MGTITSFPYSESKGYARFVSIELHGAKALDKTFSDLGTKLGGKGGKVTGKYLLGVGEMLLESVAGGLSQHPGSSTYQGTNGGNGLALRFKGELISVVAGGGGCADLQDGGDGGGLVGNDGIYNSYPEMFKSYGGSQVAGGLRSISVYGDGEDGSFLQGGAGKYHSITSSSFKASGGGGGGGYYGGGGGTGSGFNFKNNIATSGAGGSSYIAKLKDGNTVTGGSDGTLKAIITELAIGNPQSLGFCF